MTSYSRQDVLRILQIGSRQLQGWERAGLIAQQQTYTFQDLGQLRTLRVLREEDVSAASIRHSIVAMKAVAGMTNPLLEATLVRTGTRLAFLAPTGRVAWQMSVSGAVWSADARDGQRGASFAVGTGDRHVYMIEIGGATRHFKRWKMPGVVASVAFDSNCENVVAGTWQHSSVCRDNLSGRANLQLDADSASLQYAQTLVDSDRVFVRSVPNRAGADGEAALLESDGTTLSRYPLDASASTRASCRGRKPS